MKHSVCWGEASFGQFTDHNLCCHATGGRGQGAGGGWPSLIKYLCLCGQWCCDVPGPFFMREMSSYDFIKMLHPNKCLKQNKTNWSLTQYFYLTTRGSTRASSQGSDFQDQHTISFFQTPEYIHHIVLQF